MRNADQYEKYFYMTLHDLDFFTMYQRISNIEENETHIQQNLQKISNLEK